MKLQDIYETTLQLIEEAKNPNFLATLNFVAAKGNFKNRNGRTYTTELLTKATKAFNDEIKKSNVTGLVSNLDHSKEIYPSLSSASHLITKLWMDGDEMKGSAQILATQKGKDVLTVLKAGAKGGVSLKGVGNIDERNFIKDDGSYKLLSVDIVNKPSFDKHAVISQANLFEAANPLLKEEKKSNVVPLSEFNNHVDDMLRHTYNLSFPDANFLEAPTQKHYEEYCDKHWAKYAGKVEKILKETGRTIEEFEQKEEKIDEDEELERLFEEAKMSGYKGNFEDFKKK